MKKNGKLNDFDYNWTYNILGVTWLHTVYFTESFYRLK